MILGFTKTFGVGRGKKTFFEQKIKDGRKIHTVRSDKKSRWSIGKKIHFATGVRSGNYNCFMEGICKGVQSIRIVGRQVLVDGIRLPWEELEEFAKNDGFDNLEDFWLWFDHYEPFDGKIIHWTDKKY